MDDSDPKRIPKLQALSQNSRDSLSALEELRTKLPASDPGSIINSYIFPSHPQAIVYQRALHVEMAAQREAQQPRIVCPVKPLYPLAWVTKCTVFILRVWCIFMSALCATWWSA
jgi:hypothetical protein